VDGAEGFVIARARAGDRDAFRALVEQHSRSVFRVAFRLTWNEQDAEDVVQETFLKAYRELPRFEARAQFGSWLHRIAANCAIDLIRKRPRGAAPIESNVEAMLESVASDDPGPDRQATSREVRERLEVALQALTPLERAAFTLRHVEQQPVKEISAALGQSPVATRHSIFRAVTKLRQAMAPLTRTSA
jgi:RNA polymerase sigma-70 factor, ECF subfamily